MCDSPPSLLSPTLSNIFLLIAPDLKILKIFDSFFGNPENTEIRDIQDKNDGLQYTDVDTN